MPQDNLQDYLKSVPTTDNVRADAWEAYNNAKDPNDFQQKIGALNIPTQAKADLWESKFNGKGLTPHPFNTQTPASALAADQPQAPTPPAQHEGFLSRAWDWATSPVNVGHLRESIKQAEDDSNAPPTMADANSPLHEAVTMVRHGVEGFGADAAKMLLSPLGLGMTVAGPIAEGGSAIAPIAKAGLTAAGIGFGAQGATDLVRHGITPQPGESQEDYIRRVGGDAAMLTGGAAAGLEVPDAASSLRSMRKGKAPVITQPTPTPKAPETPAPTPSAKTVTQKLQEVAAKKPAIPADRTVYVDPDFANELHAWNANSELPNKRMILRKNGTIDLAHTDPDVPGFQYTETSAPSNFSDTGANGQVPVELSQRTATRGTSTPGHYLSNQIVGDLPDAKSPVATQPETPQAAPETPAPAIAASSPTQEVTPEAPAPSAPKVEQPTIQEKQVVAADPSRGVKAVSLPVEVESPEAATGGVLPGRNPVQKGIEAPESASPSSRAVDNTGRNIENPAFQSNPKIEESSQPIEPATPTSELNSDAKVVKGPVVENNPVTPSGNITPLEAKIRPLVGQALRLSQLKVGEAASHAIDTAISESQNSGGKIPYDVADKVSKLLHEPVGEALTPAQVGKLETLRGGRLSDEPKLTYLNRSQVESQLYGENGEDLQHRIEQSQDAMMSALADPSTSPELRSRIEDAFTPDKNGNMKYVLFDRKIQYPGPTELPADHPEAPFTTHAFGHEITPNTIDNLDKATGTRPRDKFLSTSSSDRYVTPEERAKLKELEGTTTPGPNPSDMLSEIIGSPGEDGEGQKGRVFQGGDTSKELQDYTRQVQRNALSRKLAEVQKQLVGHVTEWNELRNGASTPLMEQLSKLSPEARAHLPEELFNAKSPESTTASTNEAPGNEQPGQTSNKAKTVKSRQETSVAGIKTTKYDGLIASQFPDAASAIDRIQQWVKDNASVNARQKMYNNAMATFHNALESGDDYALKKVVDAVTRKGEMGSVGANLEQAHYTSDQINAVNSSVADNILQRWERMSESELLKKKQGLWKDELVNRIEGSVPTAADPVTYAQQAETYAELKDRYEQLKRQVGPSKDLSQRLVDMADDWADKAKAKQIYREVRGAQHLLDVRRQATFEQVDRLMNQLPLPEQDRFYDNIMRGSEQVGDLFDAIDKNYLNKWEAKNGPVPDPNLIASAIRAEMDAARDRVTETSGNLQEFITNYMPGLYDNQARSRQFAENWASRRPMAGNSDFLKQKIYEFHSDALKAGLQPVTSNPVRAMLMRAEQLNRYSMAHEFKNRLVDSGLAEFYSKDQTPPEGHEQLNDRLFGTSNGSYYAPASVARAYNNFMGRGLAGSWKVPYTNFSLYDAIRHVNNMANQMQLGISLFHGVETMLNSGFSTMALGLRQAINEGKVFKGSGNVVKGMTFVAPIVEDAWNGAKGLGNFRDPEANLNYAELTNDLQRANANVPANPEFKLQQIERMKKNWSTASDDLLDAPQRAWAATKAAGNLLASGIEATSWPLMHYLIPRVKIGAFYRMAEQIHSEYAGADPDTVTSQLQQAWDSVDNRFGEMNYDNTFMGKTTKDIAQLMVRSPGWNIGTAREVGGGVMDLGKSALSAAKGGKVQISNRTAYTGALVMGTMSINAIYQYLHTGNAPKGVDYFFPQDGTKTPQGEINRMYPKDYVYDFINFYHDPEATLWHKAAPDISTMSDLIKNEDYYHREIRDPGASPVANAKSTLAYLAHQFVPFSFGNLQENQLRNDNHKAESFMGILPAPRWAGRSNAENLAYNYFEKTQPSGSVDAWTLERKKSFVQLRNAVAQGRVTDEQVGQAIESGKINPKMAKYLYATVHKPQLQMWTEALRSPNQVWNIWTAATPAEKQTLLPTVIKKIASQTTGDEQRQYMDKIQTWIDQHPN